MIGPGDILNNRYRVVRTFGQGGFSTVYRAWDMVLGCPCALKENPDANPHVQRQFLREAKILANLHQNNLPRVSDFFIENGRQYLVMEFVEGQDLQDMLEDRGGPLPEDQVLPWILQVCDALTYLHTRKPPIIHRDVKPANIKITPDGIAMLVDFGIAKQEPAHKKTTVAAQAVTPGFSPLEQYGKGSTDARTDVYALGATLYTMLTGVEPPESVQRVVHDPLTPARTHNPGISLRSAAALSRALQMDPQQRFQSAADFKAALAPTTSMHPSAQRLRPPSASGVAGAAGGGSLPVGGAPAGGFAGGQSAAAPIWGKLAGFGLAALVLLLVGLLLRPTARPPRPFPVEQAAAPSTAAASMTAPGAPTSLAANEAAPSAALAQTMASPDPQTIAANATLTPAPSAAPSATPALMRYTVQAGDTCSEIAERFGVSLRELSKLNDLPADCGVIYPGQALLAPIPDVYAIATLTPTPNQAIATAIAAVDGAALVYVPSGQFLMGSLVDDVRGGDEEKPQHSVYLKAYWIDRTEVTNAMYARCVQVGKCRPPAQSSSQTRPAYYDEAEFGAFPVVYVAWQDAQAYCAWAGRRLPSEAEWEKAARGPDGGLYPWGDASPTLKLANFGGLLGDTTAVGSAPAGAAPYGALDMAGNVAEWTADWFNKAAYTLSEFSNPSGPATGEFRVLRGGSWFNQANTLRAAFRLWNYPDLRSNTIGFRCAR